MIVGCIYEVFVFVGKYVIYFEWYGCVLVVCGIDVCICEWECENVRWIIRMFCFYECFVIDLYVELCEI